MGEVLRSSYAKPLSAKSMGKLRPIYRTMRQWGVGFPGAVEAMVHWRGTIEEMIKAGILEPMVALDVDNVNMFGNT